MAQALKLVSTLRWVYYSDALEINYQKRERRREGFGKTDRRTLPVTHCRGFIPPIVSLLPPFRFTVYLHLMLLINTLL